jgi:hypothetical protein
LSRIQKILQGWKTDFDVAQKEKRFLKGLANAPDILGHPPVIEGDEVNFSHSGHTGDVIYSMPAMYVLAKGRKINLYLRLHQPVTDFTKKMRHPNGNVMLNEKSVEMLRPLLLNQPGIKTCKALENETVHYDLSIFKPFPFDLRMASITRYYLFTYGIGADLWKPWLQVTLNESYSDAIVVARSSRYHSPKIDYGFLQKYPRIVFIGLPDEYEDMKLQIPRLQYKPVADFLELAEVIAGSRLFIGNQSFPFALAEALKVRRILEVFYQTPNVMAEGPNGYMFCYQPQFEKLVSDLLDG